MLEFKRVSKGDAARLRAYYEGCDYGLCEYSVGTKIMWRKALNFHWAEAAGCLVVRSGKDGRYSFDYPVPLEDGDVEQALDAIERWCTANGAPLRYGVIPAEKVCTLLARYPYVCVSDNRTWRDYVYDCQDLQLFAGRRYSGQRNHIKKFRAQWPNATLRRLTVKDNDAIERFWQDFEAEFPKGNNQKALGELKLSKEMFKLLSKPYFVAGVFFDGDKLIALSLA